LGKYGIAALATIKASFMGTPAVQDKGGPGTERSHWRDAAFGDEMMTAYLSASYQPMSALSVESFRDLGYTVDSSAADSFNVSASGYTVPNVPYSEVPKFTPTWYDWNDGGTFWTSTTIWIIACVGGAVVIVVASLVYTRIKRRRNSYPRARSSNPPMPMSSNTASAPQYPTASSVVGRPPIAQPVMTPARQQTEIPIAIPVSNNSRHQRPVDGDQLSIAFMEVTGCRDRQVAERYLRESGGDISRAIDRYLQTNDRQMAVV
jgi:hypothetical protein